MSTHQEASYTTEEIADLLKVSKLTVYDLIKKGDLRAYRVGRQMRIDAEDLEAYKERSKSGGAIDKQEKAVSNDRTSIRTRHDPLLPNASNQSSTRKADY